MRIILAGLLLALGVFAVPARNLSAATSAPATLDAHAPVYLALGDSLAFGTGASDPATTGYVPIVHETLRDAIACESGGAPPCPQLQLLNLGVSGATTDTLIQRQLPAAIDVIQRRNGDGDPGNDVRVITVDIGGNDAVRGVFDACADEVTVACPRAVQETLAMIERNLTAILRQLRVAAGPETEIAVMTYYNALVGCDYRDVADNAELVLQGVPGVMPGLNGVIRQVAGRAHVTVVDTFGKLGPSDLVGGEDCLHANDAGYQKIAAAFIEVLTRGPVDTRS